MTTAKSVKRKTKSERTTEAQIAIESEMLKQIEDTQQDTQQDTNKCSEYDIETDDTVLYTYTRHLRRL